MGAMCPQTGSLKPFLRSQITLEQPATQKVEGHWRHAGIPYRDNLVRLVVDVPDLMEHREWMRRFKDRWKIRFEQLELWMVSYLIDLE